MIDLTVEELRGVKRAPVPEAELRRAKDHLKGSLMLEPREHGQPDVAPRAGRRSTSTGSSASTRRSRAIERVTAADVQRVAAELFSDGALAGTVLGPSTAGSTRRERLGSMRLAVERRPAAVIGEAARPPERREP